MTRKHFKIHLCDQREPEHVHFSFNFVIRNILKTVFSQTLLFFCAFLTLSCVLSNDVYISIYTRTPCITMSTTPEEPTGRSDASKGDRLFKSCWSCRLISGGGLILAGAYVFSAARKVMRQGGPTSMGTVAQITFAASKLRPTPTFCVFLGKTKQT